MTKNLCQICSCHFLRLSACGQLDLKQSQCTCKQLGNLCKPCNSQNIANLKASVDSPSNFASCSNAVPLQLPVPSLSRYANTCVTGPKYPSVSQASCHSSCVIVVVPSLKAAHELAKSPKSRRQNRTVSRMQSARSSPDNVLQATPQMCIAAWSMHCQAAWKPPDPFKKLWRVRDVFVHAGWQNRIICLLKDKRARKRNLSTRTQQLPSPLNESRELDPHRTCMNVWLVCCASGPVVSG